MAARIALRALARDARGAVALEFLVAFVPVFVLFLGTTQLALLYAADLVVRHAAITGVRAASVVLTDDPAYYDDEPVGTIDASSGRASDNADADQALRSLFDEPAMDAGGAAPSPGAQPGPRLSAIRRAVALPLAAIAPEPFALVALTSAQRSLAGELGALPLTRLASGLGLYPSAALALTFPIAPGSAQLHAGHIPAQPDVTLRVTYLYRCGVPLAAALLCDSHPVSSLLSSFGIDKPSKDQELAWSELQQVPSPGLQQLLLAAGGRYRVLRAEATSALHVASSSCKAEGS